MAIEVIVNLKAWGFGDPEPIATLKIGNRDGYSQTCDYDYCFGAPNENDEIVYQPWYLVRGHHREDGIWALIAQILQQHYQGAPELSDYTGE